MKNFILSRKGAAAAFGLLIIAGTAMGLIGESNAASPRLPYGATFQSLLPGLVGNHLTELTGDQTAVVEVTPARALSAAENFAGIASGSNVVDTVSLGSFTDSGSYHKLPSGQVVAVAVNLPAYVVTFSGLSLPTTLGSGYVSHEAVVVNAATGVVVESIKFY